MAKGVIVKGIGGFYYVKSENNDIAECRARGIFRKDNIKPMIGDRVIFENGSIREIEKRKNQLVRPPVANIDNLVVVVATVSPEPDFMLIDKMLINAEAQNIKPMLCINKTDLKSPDSIKSIYEKAGYRVFEISCEKNIGQDKLQDALCGATTAFSGLSGVGKSSILNLLTNAGMETGNVSDRIKRGRHTTRHVELLELAGGGFVLDTPGFSSLEIKNVKREELYKYFPEFGTGVCRFKGCSHINEPDCHVKDKLLSGKISKVRYENYCKLYSELEKIKDWEN